MHVDQTACPRGYPATVNAAARELKRDKAITVCHRQHQIAVGRDRIYGHDKMPHARLLAGWQRFRIDLAQWGGLSGAFRGFD